MADFGRRLLSSVLMTRDIAAAAQAGVSPTWFRNREQGEVWRFISAKTSEFGSVPSVVSVKASYPNFSPIKVTDDPGFVLDQFLGWHRDRVVYDVVSDSVDLVAQERHADALDLLRSRISDLDRAVATVSDMDLATTAEDRRADYEALRSTPDGMLGMPTGFPTIDLATAGLQPGQLVTIIASPKTGKSQLALKVARHINSQGHAVVFQSFEMGNREQYQRFDALSAGVSYDRLRRGQLTLSEDRRLSNHLSTPLPASFVLSDSSAAISVSALGARVSAMPQPPDLLCVDGVYLMVDDATGESNTPQALTGITRSLKRLAQRLDIPVLITTQTLLWKQKGNRIDASSIGYSSSFLQDSDVVIALERTEDDDRDHRVLKIVESRQCGPVEVALDWDWDRSVFAESDPEATPFPSADGDLYSGAFDGLD